MYLEKCIFGLIEQELCAGCGYVGPQTNHLRTLFSQIYIRRPHRVQVQIASSALEKLNFLQLDDKEDISMLSDSDEFEDDL